ncbi:MAG: hypothetical protein RSF67_08420 [Clostridia bacterium]
MLEFWKNEYSLFLNDLNGIKRFFKNLVGINTQPMLEAATEEAQTNIEEVYTQDEIDHKISAYCNEDINSLRETVVGDKTHHEVLRDYAKYFKPYNGSHTMCSNAFKNFYDKNATEISTNMLPVEHVRIIQNNMDLFVEGQEGFGDSQIVDSRVCDLFKKMGRDETIKITNILSDNTKNNSEINENGERILAEVVNHMVEKSVKISKDKTILDTVKDIVTEKYEDAHAKFDTLDDWNDEFKKALSDERKYNYALNRIKQYEDEQAMIQFEQSMESII